MFSGNELAALLGWWMFSNWKEAHPDPADVQKVFMLATTVSSKILQTFARVEGFHFEVSWSCGSRLSDGSAAAGPHVRLVNRKRCLASSGSEPESTS